MSNYDKRSVTLLVADDDAEDCMMIQEALHASRLINDLRFVKDGEELLDYLLLRGDYPTREVAPMPGLLLLDLNMPRKDGREALGEIKQNPHLKMLPIVVLTTSKEEEDIIRSYNLGVNSFITKPVSFDSLVNVLQVLSMYWFEIVELPPLEGE